MKAEITKYVKREIEKELKAYEFADKPVGEVIQGAPDNESIFKWRLIQPSRVDFPKYDKYLFFELGTAVIPQQEYTSELSIINKHYTAINIAESIQSYDSAVRFSQRLRARLLTSRSRDGRYAGMLLEPKKIFKAEGLEQPPKGVLDKTLGGEQK